MSELLDIAEKLLDKYGSGKHWAIVKAEKTGNSWTFTVQPVEEESEGSDESNK